MGKGKVSVNDYFQLDVDEVSYSILLPDSETDYIQQKIKETSVPYEIEMLRDMALRIEPGDLVLDAGANIGNHSLYLAVVAKCNVIAFEPNLHLCEAIKCSARKNGLSNRLIIKNHALGAEEATAHFKAVLPDNLGAQSIEFGEGNIDVIPLDSMTFSQPVKVIKIDVEGMELPVLIGAKRLLNKDRPLVYIECLDEKQFRQASKFFVEIGYAYWDTFNASPTHLFLPSEQVTIDQRIARLQFKVEEANYRAGYTLRETRERLDNANLKYRVANEHISELKDQLSSLSGLDLVLAAEKERCKRSDDALEKARLEALDIKSELDETKLKYRKVTEQLTQHKQIINNSDAELIKLKESARAESIQRQSLDDKLIQQQELFKQQQTQNNNQLLLLEQAVTDKNNQITSLYESLKVAREEVITLQTRLDDANRDYRVVTEQLHSVEQSLIQQQELLKHQQIQNDEQRLHLQQAVTDKNNQVTLLHKSLESAREEVITLQTRFNEANHEHRAVAEQLAQSEVDRMAANMIVSDLTSRRKEMDQRLALSCDQFQKEIDNLKEDIHFKSEALNESHNQVIHLEEKLKDQRDYTEGLNQKYRELSTLQKSVIDERNKSRSELNRLQESLDNANSKYRHLTRQEIPLLKQKLEIQVQRHKEKTDYVRREAELKVAKLRDTLSFRLGYILLHCLKSHRNFKRLPKDLWLLRCEAVRRKQTKFVPGMAVLRQKSEESSNAPKLAPDSPLSTGPVGTVDSRLEIPPLNFTDGLRNLRVACIMDEFTFGAYAPECMLTQLTPADWETELESSTPELLFIESAWRGKDELWGNKVGHTSQELQGVVAWCRQHNIPTLFWNKEDPVHFETFLNTARLFDYVFTTDIDCIHRYKAALKHERIFLLPFACQPKVHNPIEKYERKDAFCFAGAYYARYPERIKDLESFVDELPAFKPLEIFDRNYGQQDPNYMFPQYYQPCIVGTLPYTEIDRAYKGYRYAINLNSIKQSQSMFARRVYELLASNTITVSNFSRGVRLLFGDLVVTTDSGGEQVRRLKELTADDLNARKLRLAALRKVMQEHTYGQRLAYVASKVSGQLIESQLPHIAMLARARSCNEQKKIIENFERQSYQNSTLYLVIDKGAKQSGHLDKDRIVCLKQSQIKMKTIGSVVGEADLVAGMVAGDYYGPHYLIDIALATRYSEAKILGKASYYAYDYGEIVLQQEGQPYSPVNRLSARSSAIQTALVADKEMYKWVTNLPGAILESEAGLALDEFNYCRKVALKDEEDVATHVNDLTGLNTGISIDELLSRAEKIAPEGLPEDESATLSGKLLSESFTKSPSNSIKLQIDGDSWQVSSSLDDGKHEYLYASVEHTPESLGFKDELKVYLDVTPGLNIQLVVFFLDSQKQKISHVIKHPNRNQNADIPFGTAWLRLGLRFYAGGSAEIKGLVLGHRNLQPAEMIGQAKHLLLTNHYPSYEDLYRNGFVHSRVRAYREHNCKVDVFRLRTNEGVSYHEFEDVDVTTGAQEVLHQMLSTGKYKSVLVHFLDQEMWEVLRHHIDHIKVHVWVHGAEIQPWTRRAFNYRTEQERDGAKIQSDKRMVFWRSLLKNMPPNLKLVFVSKYLANLVMEDLGFLLPEGQYEVIHNAIDTNMFSFVEKAQEQRKKVLSIRPYASRVYANDLSVEVIRSLSKKSWFKDMEFRMIGDGKLFNETLEPLREFSNVFIEQRFLSRAEIAKLHREYGVFLCPTRMDSQGVSRDEAMSSGLVPVTNSVAAIPEFVDETCGIIADKEDAEGIATGIASLYESPEKFLAMSKAASERVRKQSNSFEIISRELSLFSPLFDLSVIDK
jgi:FkbM family methyltransferase